MPRSSERTPAERRQTMKAIIDALPAAPEKGGIRATTDFRTGSFSLVIAAARARHMSVAAYVRRAALAMSCYDLDVPLAEALSLDPRVTRETGFPVDDPDGTRFGSWEITGLAGEE